MPAWKQTQEWKVEDTVHANKIIRSLKAQNVCLRYENLGDDSSLKLLILMLCMAIFPMVKVKEDTLYFSLVKINNVLY